MVIETCPKCGGDLISYVLTSYPPIPGKKCTKCEWRWQGEVEEIKRVPFIPPTVPIVVVRCKDCKNWTKGHVCLAWSRFGSIETKAEQFCSYGKHREDVE